MAAGDEDLDFGSFEGSLAKLSLGGGGDAAHTKELEARAAELEKKGDAASLAELARVRVELDDEEAALAAINKAIAADPKSVAFLQQKAEIQLEMHEAADAHKTLDAALALDGSNADVLFDKGLAYQQEEKADAAVAEFKKAIAANSKHSKSHVALGKALMSSSDFKQRAANTETALGHFRSAVEGDAKCLDALANAGTILFLRAKDGDKAEAAKFFSSAAQIDPSDAQLRGRLIQCYDATGNDKAREDARASLHKDYAAGVLNPSYTAVGRYCCGQFETNGKFVMVYDHFEVPDKGVRYAFLVYKKGEVHPDKVLFRVALEKNGGKWDLAAHNADGSKKDVSSWDGAEPAYSDVAKKASEFIAA